MGDPAEAIQTIFSLVISVGVLVIIIAALRGDDVAVLASIFAEIIPFLVIVLLVFYLIAVIRQ